MFKFFTTLVLLTCSAVVFATPIKLKNGYPREYTVKPGDSLWSIANKFLEDPLCWTKLYHANPNIHNPDKIYPGEIIQVGLLNGNPYLQVLPGGTLKLSPHIRSEPINNAIPAISIDMIKPFLNNSRIVQEQTLARAPHIIAHAGEHVVAGSGNTIYVEGMRQYQSDNLSDFAIVRKNRTYVDPRTKEILGYEALDIGEAHLDKPGDPSTMIVTKSRMEVLRGDRIMPLCEQYDAAFQPRVSDALIEGEIIGVMGGVTQIGQYQVVVFDRGSENEVRVGDMFAVFQQGRTIQNPDKSSHNRVIHLPGQRAGDMMVFRVFDRVSYGLILHATMPMHLMDIVKTPVD